MHARWLIVDGYSLMHRDPELTHARESNLILARQLLIRKLEEISGSLADRITVVFDGAGAGPDEPHGASPVEVIFSPREKTADTVIERLVHGDDDPVSILVVTSDRAERETVSTRGAQTMSCGEFVDLCDGRQKQLLQQARRKRSHTPKPSLGDFFPQG